MKKKTVTIIAILVIIAGALAVYFLRPKSPSKSASLSANGVDIEVSYSGPYKKGRLIFGEGSKGALVPYGEYWRLGANKATEISFNKDIKFGGEDVKAGTYSMYAIPGEREWQIVLNGNTGKSGSELPDHAEDILTITAIAESFPTETEQFIIDFDETDPDIFLRIIWDRTVVSVPIRKI